MSHCWCPLGDDCPDFELKVLAYRDALARLVANDESPDARAQHLNRALNDDN